MDANINGAVTGGLVSGDTVVAVATPQGVGGIAVIRLSGPDADEIASRCWKGVPIDKMVSHTAHLGKIIDPRGELLDEVVLTIFRAPRSFTGETVIEIACHGSKWIQREIVNTLVHAGARPAGPGEFTQRAFASGRLDLAQAEAVADLIAASSRAALRLAQKQAGGDFSRQLNALRESLIEIGSLLELELDFSEEEVEFADRLKLRDMAERILATVERLAASYSTGRAIKEGVPVVIAGAPNAGKSTLLNALLGEEKAIVTDIPGTTRDVIEDTREIDGILYRFIDTAGLRVTDDVVERMGINRAEERIATASAILWMLDMSDAPERDLEQILARIDTLPDTSHILLLNKTDKLSVDFLLAEWEEGRGIRDRFASVIPVSAKNGKGVDEVKEQLALAAGAGMDLEAELIVTNARHYDALQRGADALRRLIEGLDLNLPGDLLAQDLRAATYYIGSVTGSVSEDDLLASIFANFCIGK